MKKDNYDRIVCDNGCMQYIKCTGEYGNKRENAVRLCGR